MNNLNVNIIQNSLKNYKESLESLGVKNIHIFGSTARQTSTSKSDIDFLVEFKPGEKNFDNYMNLVFLLEEIFKNKIDLLTSDSISGSFKKSIEEESILIEV